MRRPLAAPCALCFIPTQPKIPHSAIAMLSLQLLVAAAALAGHARAHAHAHVAGTTHHQQSRSINALNLVNYGYQLAKRQSTEDDAADASFPSECTEQCGPYIQQGSECAGKEDGSTAGQDDIVACSCTTDFFNSAVTCMKCAPSAFQDGAGYTAKDIISQAIQSCNCMGYSVGSIDLSALGGGDSTLPAQACNSSSSTGQAEATADNESSAGNNAGTLSGDDSNAQEDTSTSSTASATFIPATRSSTAGTATRSSTESASSTSASGTGAASTVQAQQVLAFIVATAASAMGFVYVV